MVHPQVRIFGSALIERKFETILYFQMSAGKSFTMHGTKTAPGILPLAIVDLFKKRDAALEADPDLFFHIDIRYPNPYISCLKQKILIFLFISVFLKLCRTVQFQFPQSFENQCTYSQGAST